jgi:hypothetical protein
MVQSAARKCPLLVLVIDARFANCAELSQLANRYGRSRMFFPGLRKGRRILLAALDAGKHVYCEWPLGRNLQEAEELAAAQNTPESTWPAAVAGRLASVICFGEFP